MSVIAKSTASNDVVNGIAVSMKASGLPLIDDVWSGDPYDSRGRWPSGDALQIFTNLDTRYRNDPGPNGSGNWGP